MTQSVSLQVPADPRPPETVPPRRWWGLGVLAVAQFMVVLDATIVNIALPEIGRGLDMGQTSLAWIITAYVIAFGGLLPLGGRLADLLGRRRVFAIGVGVFTAASLGAGVAQNSTMLIATRAVQGGGAALLAPAALALVTVMFPAAADRAKALSIWGAVAAGGSAAGVLLGGLLTGGLGWRSVFLINVPVGIVVLGTAFALVPQNRARIVGRLRLARFDLPGAVAVTAGLAALVATLSQGGTWGWGSAATLAGFVTAAVLLIGFVVVESHVTYPLIPTRLFRLRTVSVGNLVMLLIGAAMFGLFFFLSLYEQAVLGYGPIATGLSQLPLAAALVLAAAAAGPLIAKLGTRAVLGGSLVVFAAGLAWMGLAPVGGSFLVDLLGPTLLIGLGLGGAFVPVTAVGVSDAPRDEAGVAGALINTSQQIGGAIGLAALVALTTTRITRAQDQGSAPLDALNHGYSWAFIAAAGIAIVAAALSAAGIRRTDATDVDAIEIAESVEV